jgi:hypothetical protein
MNTPIFALTALLEMTATCVTSLPVPDVVGTRMMGTGRSSARGQR